MDKIKIYSTHNCPFCIMAKKFMDSKNISYENIFVDEDEKLREEMVKISGQLGVPVIVIKEEVYYGFDEKVQKALIENIN